MMDIVRRMLLCGKRTRQEHPVATGARVLLLGLPPLRGVRGRSQLAGSPHSRPRTLSLSLSLFLFLSLGPGGEPQRLDAPRSRAARSSIPHAGTPVRPRPSCLPSGCTLSAHDALSLSLCLSLFLLLPSEEAPEGTPPRRPASLSHSLILLLLHA